MIRARILFAAMVLASPLAAQQQPDRARIDALFAAHAVIPDAPAAAVLPDFSGRDAWARTYRTRIREGMQEGINFAGHFALIRIGCGTGCNFAFLADLRTGQVYDFPYGGEANYRMALGFRPDSRAISVTWEDPFETCNHQVLAWTGQGFVLLDQATYPLVQDYCEP